MSLDSRMDKWGLDTEENSTQQWKWKTIATCNNMSNLINSVVRKKPDKKEDILFESTCITEFENLQQ